MKASVKSRLTIYGSRHRIDALTRRLLWPCCPHRRRPFAACAKAITMSAVASLPPPPMKRPTVTTPGGSVRGMLPGEKAAAAIIRREKSHSTISNSSFEIRVASGRSHDGVWRQLTNGPDIIFVPIILPGSEAVIALLIIQPKYIPVIIHSMY